MGTYNCQDCMTKEINFLNELLLDGDIIGKDTMNNNNELSPSKVSIKASKDNLIKALNKANLSPEKKKYYENFINEHPNSVIDLGQNNNIVNGNDSYEQNNEIKNIEEDEYLEEHGEIQEVGQSNFYQMDQQQRLEQERLAEEYKQQQLLILREQENILIAEAEELKKQIEQAQNEERMLEESNHFQEMKNETLEPQKIVNKDEEQQRQIIKKELNENSKEKEIQQIANDSKNLRNKGKNSKNTNKRNNNRKRNINRNNEINNPNRINTNTQNSKTEILKQERVIRNVFNLEEQKTQNQPIVLRTKEQYIKQIEQIDKSNYEESGDTEENKEEEQDEEEEKEEKEKGDNNDAKKEMNNEFKKIENENFIYSQKFTTETYEPEKEKNDYLDDHEDYNNEKNNNNNNDDESVGPKDNRKKGANSQRGNNNLNNNINNNINYMNNNNNYNYKYILKNSPKDNRGSFKVNRKMESVDQIGPRDSRRKDVMNNKFNDYYPKMNLAIKTPVKPDMFQEMPYNNYKSKEQYNTANPKSHQQQYDFIKREVLSSSSSQRSFKNNKKMQYPLFNQYQNEKSYQ